MDSGLEYRLCLMLADILSIRIVSSDDSFFDLGGDSLAAVSFFERIESNFEVTLPVSTILDHSTAGDIARVIRERGSNSLLSRMFRYRKGGSGPKFFCAHGNLSQLFKFLHPEQSVYVLTPHGLDGFAAPHSVSEMAEDYLNEIQAIQKEGPYYLGGYSFGGLVILEVAARLQKLGHRVAFLGILDTRFEQPNDAAPTDSLAKLEEIEKHLSESGRIPQSLRMRYFPLTFTRAGMNHHASAYAGVLTYFKARGNRRTDKYRDGCKHLILENYHCYEVAGDHVSMLEPPHVQQLAGVLQQCLDEASRHQGHI
jgi:thioesterase domain-containing protein/acyl carrier protein